MERFKKGFTLVELIVVVTILAILATIGFVSYSSYLTGVRDTNRISQLRSISDGLSLYSTTNNLPIPEDSVEVNVSVGGTNYTIASQGYAGANILESIDFDKGGVDPRDNTHFTYMLTKDRSSFQLMAFLEESVNLNAGFINKTNAVNLQDRIAITSGSDLGVVTNTGNVPIQEVSSVTSAGELLLDGTGDDYIAHINNEEPIVGNDSTILYGSYVEIAGRGNKNCKEILSQHPYIEGTDGRYWIRAGGESIKVPCDMTTEGGGWTLVLHGTDTDIEKYDARGANNWRFSQTLIPFKGEDFSFKLTDNTINEIRGNGSYMSVGERELDANTYRYFTPKTCEYDHELGANGSCSQLYAEPEHSTLIACGPDAGWAGIGCWNPPGTQGIITNLQSNPNHAVCFNPFAGCTNQGIDASVKMYVR